MISLVCYDLDGTINNSWNLLPALKIKMNKLKKAGVKQAIITGREAVGTLYFVYNCQFEFDYVGCGGGPVIAEPLRKPLVVDLFDKTVLSAVTDHNIHVMIIFDILKYIHQARMVRSHITFFRINLYLCYADF